MKLEHQSKLFAKIPLPKSHRCLAQASLAWTCPSKCYQVRKQGSRWESEVRTAPAVSAAEASGGEGQRHGQQSRQKPTERGHPAQTLAQSLINSRVLDSVYEFGAS